MSKSLGENEGFSSIMKKKLKFFSVVCDRIRVSKLVKAIFNTILLDCVILFLHIFFINLLNPISILIEVIYLR